MKTYGNSNVVEDNIDYDEYDEEYESESDDYLSEHTQKMKLPLRKKIFRLLGLVGVIGLLCGIGAGVIYIKDMKNRITPQPVQDDITQVLNQTSEVKHVDDNANYFLVAGTHNGGSEVGILVLTRLDIDNAIMTMVSIPPNANAYEGGTSLPIPLGTVWKQTPEQAISQIEDICDVNIDHYIEVDIDGASMNVSGLQDMVKLLSTAKTDLSMSEVTNIALSLKDKDLKTYQTSLPIVFGAGDDTCYIIDKTMAQELMDVVKSGEDPN